MEGRNPPPLGHHPFIDDEAATNKKFWATPASRGFFRFVTVMGIGWMGLMFLHTYFTRHDKRLLGYSLEMTPEQQEKRLAMMQSFPGKRRESSMLFNLNIFSSTDKTTGYDLRFDDSVKHEISKLPKPLLDRIER